MLLLYDILRWEEKSFIEAAKKLGIEIKPVHVPSICGKVGRTDADMEISPFSDVPVSTMPWNQQFSWSHSELM
jgi:hypothetical protein